MKNRAKCKLCQTIIESFHSTDYVVCKCGEISVDGGEAMRCSANDFKNFLRVDDEGNDIFVILKNSKEMDEAREASRPSKEELLNMLDETIKVYNNLPRHAMDQAVSHSDFCSLMMLLSAILRS
jgi:hypothetical protein